MFASCRLLITLAILAGSAPALAVPGPDDGELAHNRRLLEKWRADPEHYNRLKQDWRAFRALPPEKQARIRKLDHDLHQEDSTTQTHLERVLDRYATWLGRLSKADRPRVEAIADTGERLKVIRELRERDWLDRQPRATRERVLGLPAEQKSSEIARLRKEERDYRQQWQKAIKRPQLTRLADFPPEVRTFINESLLPLLTDQELQALKKAEGRVQYGATLVELADRHPIVLPPSPRIGPRSFKDRPDLRQRLQPKLIEGRLREVEGKWPDFALHLAELARARKIPLSQPLGPCQPADFAPSVQRFIKVELLPKLKEADRKRLTAAEGSWPDYPHTLLALAKEYNLKVPGMEPPEFWDGLRAELPEVPDRVLRDFALTRLSRDDLAALQLSYADPASRERIKQKLFEKNPDELRRLRTLDIEGAPRKGKMRF